MITFSSVFDDIPIAKHSRNVVSTPTQRVGVPLKEQNFCQAVISIIVRQITLSFCPIPPLAVTHSQRRRQHPPLHPARTMYRRRYPTLQDCAIASGRCPTIPRYARDAFVMRGRLRSASVEAPCGQIRRFRSVSALRLQSRERS